MSSIHPAKLVTTAFNPFDLDQDRAYRVWRDWKLEHAPTRLEQLLVEIRNPLHLTPAESLAILDRCAHTNMALYACDPGPEQHKDIPLAIGQAFGLEHLDHNLLADEDAITSLTVNGEGEHPHYIPYTNRPIQWHTDGYYNAPHQQVYGLMLHCVHPAAEGGANDLLDHELAYIFLRDTDPDYIRALMQPDAMTIPERRDANGVARPARSGPVFSIDVRHHTLHMRYTARCRNIQWKADPVLDKARQRLEDLLASDQPFILHGRLERGMGLICNNVLHTRRGFADYPGLPARLLYRARFHDRIQGTQFDDLCSWR